MRMGGLDMKSTEKSTVWRLQVLSKGISEEVNPLGVIKMTGDRTESEMSSLVWGRGGG